MSWSPAVGQEITANDCSVLQAIAGPDSGQKVRHALLRAHWRRPRSKNYPRLDGTRVPGLSTQLQLANKPIRLLGCIDSPISLTQHAVTPDDH